MELLGFFKKKQNVQTNNDSLTLEQLLQKATTKPAFRAEFYKRLLTDELVVITQNSNLTEGGQTLQKDSSINIVSYPDGKIPVFTSTDRIFDKGVTKEQVEYIRLKGENLFGLCKSTTFLLNPYSDYGKELLPDEIESLLNGTIGADTTKILTVEEETKVQIGQPAKYPTEIVNALKKLFSERSNVKAAYLGWIFSSESGEPPHYIFALDTDGKYLQSLAQEAGFIAKQFLEQREFVDFITIDRDSGLSDYFLKQTKPFYKR
ncbi:MAG: enhanced serine sensitivity protein SseB C-terminal domain-containing protein [Planctomycetaceae bacterium]|jgi:hypothetical protein|nr:enhanced serine sensitivity protein SseB C-terminal domain-containing protein [Planctomycetaceae bacterium]